MVAAQKVLVNRDFGLPNDTDLRIIENESQYVKRLAIKLRFSLSSN